MATRLIGTDTADPRLPADVITATTGSTAADLAPGNVAANKADQTAVDLKADKTYTINTQTGTTYTLVLTDTLVTLSNASAITLTVPANSTVAYPTGTHIDLAQLGAGQVTVTGAGGVTVNATPTLKFRVQYAAATLIKLATNSWLLVGDLAAT